MDEENLGKLLQAFSNCNYIEFVKIFSMIHGFDATFEFLRNALTTIPFMAFKRKFWWSNNNDTNSNDSSSSSSSSISNPSSTNTTGSIFNGDSTLPSSSSSSSPSIEGHNYPNKRQAIRSTWEDENSNDTWTNPDNNYYYDSDTGYHRNAQKLKSSSHSTATTTTTTTINNNSNNTSPDHSSSFRKKRNSKRKLKFMDLPFELIISIFSFLKSTDLMVTSLVSREWSRFSFISTNELLIDNRNGTSLDIINRKIYKHSEYLKKIKCSHSIYFNSSSLHTIINHCRQVTDLQFYYCPNLHDSHIESICLSLPQLKRIVLHSNHLTSRTIDSLTKTKLVNVELGGFANVGIESFTKLGHIATLTSLDVSGIERDSELIQSLTTCKRLRTLRLGVATEQTICRLPFLENLNWLSIAEWDIDEPDGQQQPPAGAVPPLQLENGKNLNFLERCKKLKKLEFATTIIPPPENQQNDQNPQTTNNAVSTVTQQPSTILIRDISYLTQCSETLCELDLDISFDLDHHGKDYSFFEMTISRLVNLEILFLSSFNLDCSCWKAFSNLPYLKVLSICCTMIDGSDSIGRGLVHIGNGCQSLQKLSLINSTSKWIEIPPKSFSSLLNCQELSQLCIGGSRGGGFILNEKIFVSIGKMTSLQQLDTSNSLGVNEKCLDYLVHCPSLESLECGMRLEEDLIRSAIADWCATKTLTNCKSLKNVVVDLKLPQTIFDHPRLNNGNGGRSSPQQTSTSKSSTLPSSFQFVAKISNYCEQNTLSLSKM